MRQNGEQKCYESFCICLKVKNLAQLLTGTTCNTVQIRDEIGGGQRPKGGGNLTFSDTFFGAEGTKTLELLEIFGAFLASQTSKTLRNLGTLVKNCPIL